VKIGEELNYFLDRLLLGVMKHKKNMHYEPLKITFYLAAPVSLTHPWLHFDSLVGHLMLMNALGEDYFLLPRKFPLSRLLKGVDLPPFPIKETAEVYHASVSIFDTERMALEVMYKKFEERWAGGRKKISKASGWFKDYAMQHIYIPSRTVTFYVCADRESMQRICSILTGLGDNTRIGWGRVRSFEIVETEEDYSLVKEGKAMRPIPMHIVKSCREVVSLAWRPPYWAPENVGPCCPPFVEVMLKDGFKVA